MNGDDYIETLRKKRKLRKIRFLFILFLIFASIGFYWIGFKTDFFHVDLIKIEGNKILDEEQVIKSSGIVIGDNLLKLRKNAIIKNLLNLSYIENAEVIKKYPKSIILKINERVPVIQLNLEGKFQIIDVNGYVLENTNDKIPELPELLNLLKKEVEINQSIYSSIDQPEFHQLFITLDELNLLSKLYTIDFENSKNIVLCTKEGIIIDFGPLDSVEYKVKLLNEVMSDLRDKNMAYKKIIMNRGSNPIIITQD
ncbi:MAG TPA: FtsQ-type POTRA domain-containing protein [Tissierellaceae bacterium]